MRAKFQECRSRMAKILILSVIFLLLAPPLAEARSFIVYNTSAPAQAYFIVNGTTGNSGIGLMNPAYPLDVSGAGRLSGNLYLGTAGRYVYDTGSVIGVSSGLLLGGNLDMGGNNLTNYNYLAANDSAKLNGQVSSYYLDTSSAAQTKSGSLTVSGAWLNATNLNVSTNAYFGGNVGIGTASPIAKLDVNGVVRPTGWLDLASGSGLEMGWTGSESRIYSQNRSGGGWQPLALAGSNIQLLVGNVGIGTTNPLGVLHTKGWTGIFLEWTGTDAVKLNPFGAGYAGVGPSGSIHSIILSNSTSGYGTGIYYDPPNRHGGLYLYSEDGAYLPLISMKAGNVGIGTTSPGSKLEVNGNIGFTGATATGARINSGSFTTNGVDNRPIAHGLGVTPKLVVWMRAAGNNYWGISIGTTEQTVVNGQVPGTVTAPDSTYWYAKANTYNSNPSGSDTTWWVAYG